MEMENGGYDPQDFVAEVEADLHCAICHFVMRNPHTCKQGHPFCKVCIDLWLLRSQECPARCGKLTADGLTKCRVLSNLIDQRLVKCVHAPRPSNDQTNVQGCEWVGKLEDRQKHLKNECGFVEVPCPAMGCNTVCRRLDLLSHQTACKYREILCDECSTVIQACELESHLELHCTQVEIECPHECGERLLRCDLEEHERNCPNVVVECAFAHHGCKVKAKRRKINAHQEEAVEVHAQLASTRAERLQAQQDKLTREQEESQRQVETLQQQLDGSKEKIASLERDLEDSSSQASSLRQRTSKLEMELKTEQQRASLLQLMGPTSSNATGEAVVTWKIPSFPAKARQKQRIDSKVFHVQTRAGVYHLVLSMSFYRRHGSTEEGLVGLFVRHNRENGGCLNFPVDLGGTKFFVANNGKACRREIGLGERLESGMGRGFQNFLPASKIPDLTWTTIDAQADENRTAGPDDVFEFLAGDALVVRASVRLTPPREICV